MGPRPADLVVVETFAQVNANRDVIPRFEKKIQAALTRVWTAVRCRANPFSRK